MNANLYETGREDQPVNPERDFSIDCGMCMWHQPGFEDLMLILFILYFTIIQSNCCIKTCRFAVTYKNTKIPAGFLADSPLSQLILVFAVLDDTPNYSFFNHVKYEMHILYVHSIISYKDLRATINPYSKSKISEDQTI